MALAKVDGAEELARVEINAGERAWHGARADDARSLLLVVHHGTDATVHAGHSRSMADILKSDDVAGHSTLSSITDALSFLELYRERHLRGSLSANKPGIATVAPLGYRWMIRAVGDG